MSSVSPQAYFSPFLAPILTLSTLLSELSDLLCGRIHISLSHFHLVLKNEDGKGLTLNLSLALAHILP